MADRRPPPPPPPPAATGRPPADAGSAAALARHVARNVGRRVVALRPVRQGHPRASALGVRPRGDGGRGTGAEVPASRRDVRARPGTRRGPPRARPGRRDDRALLPARSLPRGARRGAGARLLAQAAQPPARALARATALGGGLVAAVWRAPRRGADVAALRALAGLAAWLLRPGPGDAARDRGALGAARDARHARAAADGRGAHAAARDHRSARDATRAGARRARAAGGRTPSRPPGARSPTHPKTRTSS